MHFVTCSQNRPLLDTAYPIKRGYLPLLAAHLSTRTLLPIPPTSGGQSNRKRCITVMTLCMLVALVSAQVTFSRDWSGGKRSPPAVFDCDQFARLCRHFLHELKQEITDDKLNKHRRLDAEDVRVNFDDDK